MEKVFRVSAIVNGKEIIGLTINPKVGESNEQLWSEDLKYSSQVDNNSRQFMSTPSFGVRGIFACRPVVKKIFEQVNATPAQIEKMKYGC
jgi:hypothetical protein